MYRYDKILAALENNQNVKIDEPIPCCPKDRNCPKQNQICTIGSKRVCEQKLSIWYNEKQLFILYPRFFYDDCNGFFVESDIKLEHLIRKGILTREDLISFDE